MQNWNSIGVKELDKVGLVISPPKSYIDYIVEAVEVVNEQHAKGVIHQAATWQSGSKPESGTLVEFYEHEEPLYKIDVWKKYYFIESIGSLQLYYDLNEIETLAFVQSKAVDWLLSKCNVVPYEYENNEKE